MTKRFFLMAATGVLLAGCGSVSTVSTLPDASRAVNAAARAAAPTGTLYAANVTSVYAFPLDASGSTAAQRTITPHPTQTQVLSRIATSADGMLGILENHFVGPNNAQTEYCRLVVESATANGSPAAATSNCDGTDTGQSSGVARNALGGFDVLSSDNTLSKAVLHRLGNDGSTLINSMQISIAFHHLATDRGGHDYANTSSGEIVMYKSATTDPTMPAADFTLAGTPALGAMAVSPGADRTIYVVNSTDINNESILAINSGTTTVSRTIGPFPHHELSALAVDSQGELYVVFNPSGGGASFVRVYDASASGIAAPLRRIDLSSNISPIRAIAIAE